MFSIEYPAFMMGWLSTTFYEIGSTTAVVRWSEYVVHFIDLISDHNVTSSLVEAPVRWSEQSGMVRTGQVINLPAIAITIAITFVLIIGIRETAIINLIFVVIKVIILLIFIFACCVYVDRKNYYPFFPSNQYGITGMLHASTFVFYAYIAFESVTAVAQEAKGPTRSLPFASIPSVIISLLLYVGVCTVMVGLVPYKDLNTTYPLTEAV
jgi:APA family basic amino acid/polyamine antiporter